MSETNDTDDDKRMREMLRGINIPPCPAVLSTLITEIQRPNTNNRRVCEIVTKDVGLAAIVIKSANSPLFGIPRSISSIQEAINLIGYKALSNLVYAGLLRKTLPTEDRFLMRFWDNSVYAAMVCAELSRQLGGTVPDDAYAFGLFHDCGIPVMAQRFPEYEKVMREAATSPEGSFTQIEENHLATSHALVGYFIARTWYLPEEIALGVLYHHDYTVLHGNYNLPQQSRTLIAMSAIADHICALRWQLPDEDIEWQRALQPVADYLGRTSQSVEDFVDDMLLQLEENEQQRQSLAPHSSQN